MGTIPLCGRKALFGIHTMGDKNLNHKRLCTLLALCFRPQPRGGPELLGAPMLGGLLGELEQIQSTQEQGSEQGSNAPGVHG